MTGKDAARWLLLIHQIPPKPEYFRVKIWRRLQQVGAVAVKNSVYALPKNDETLEDFQWILREIAERGGEGSVCEAGFIDGLSDSDVEALFHTARDADYATIVAEARELERAFPAPGRKLEAERRRDLERNVTKLRRRLSEVVGLDFFETLGRQSAEGVVASLEARLNPPVENSIGASRDEYRRRVWVTRKGIHVDRIASAWLIRRFIDTEAKFKFVPARGYPPVKGEIRFDMFDAEFTHEGDRCTFEVLKRRLAPGLAPLRPIAEIIHNLDLKDAKFERPETAGVEALITGICMRSKEDEERLQRGCALFDDLFENFSRRRR